MLKEHTRKEAIRTIKIALIAWSPFFLWFFLATPYNIQQASEGKAAMAIKEKDGVRNSLGTCQSDLDIKKSKVEILDNQNRSQQQMINSLQGTLGAQQGTLNSQQTTTNNCVVALGKANTPEPPKTTFRFLVLDNNTETTNRAMMFAFTNKAYPSPIKGIVGCEKNLKNYKLWLLGAATMTSSSGELRNGVAEWEIDSPEWTPTTPLIFTLFFDGDVGKCGMELR